MLSTCRIEIHQSQPASMTQRRSEGHSSACDWWISIRHVDNTYDWRKFWKRFRECFVFQSRVSTKTVVMIFPVCRSYHKEKNKPRQWPYIILQDYYIPQTKHNLSCTAQTAFLCRTCPSFNNTVPARLEGFRTFLHYELWEKVPVAMFFPSDDWLLHFINKFYNTYQSSYNGPLMLQQNKSDNKL